MKPVWETTFKRLKKANMTGPESQEIAAKREFAAKTSLCRTESVGIQPGLDIFVIYTKSHKKG